MAGETFVCTNPPCSRELPASEFYRWRDGRRAHYCKRCYAERAERGRLLKLYGMTLEEVQALIAAQGNRCKICGGSVRLDIDHCHKTGAVRGALCPRCNKGIGLLRDDPQLLRRAATYLEQFQN